MAAVISISFLCDIDLKKKSTFFVNAVNVAGNDILPIQEPNVGVVRINIYPQLSSPPFSKKGAWDGVVV